MPPMIHAPGPVLERFLILDLSDPDDPMWRIVTVIIPADSVVASPGLSGAAADWPAVAAWVDHQLGEPVDLMPVTGALVWRAERRP